jgi:hypothetical protein
MVRHHQSSTLGSASSCDLFLVALKKGKKSFFLAFNGVGGLMLTWTEAVPAQSTTMLQLAKRSSETLLPQQFRH